MKKITLAFCLLIACAGQAFACPAGKYDVVGWNPGVSTNSQPSYRGTATVKIAGQACEVQWKIGSQEYAGVGLYDAKSKRLMVSYADTKEGWFGVADYQVANNVLNGRWVVYGDKQGAIGTEKLTKK